MQIGQLIDRLSASHMSQVPGTDLPSVIYFLQDGVLPQGATLASFRRWHVCGAVVCSKSFCTVLGINDSKLCKIKQQILDGHFEPVVTGPRAKM